MKHHNEQKHETTYFNRLCSLPSPMTRKQFLLDTIHRKTKKCSSLHLDKNKNRQNNKMSSQI